MIITGIYKNKRNFDIYIDHEFAFKVSDEGLYKLKLSKGQEFAPDERANEILKADELIRCKNRAMSMLSVNLKSEKTLSQKLKAEEFSEEAIAETLIFAREYALVNDVELAREIANKGDRQHRSKREIQQKLYQRGISRQDQQAVLEDMDIDEKENALKTAEKKYKLIRHKPKEEIMKKIMYSLSYRGFSYGAANYAISKIKQMIQEDDCEAEIEDEEI